MKANRRRTSYFHFFNNNFFRTESCHRGFNNYLVSLQDRSIWLITEKRKEIHITLLQSMVKKNSIYYVNGIDWTKTFNAQEGRIVWRTKWRKLSGVNRIKVSNILISSGSWRGEIMHISSSKIFNEVFKERKV